MKTTSEDWTRISDNWEKMVIAFNFLVPEPNNCKAKPDEVARYLVECLGLDTVKETFAVVCEAKKNDGRIYSENREYLKPSLPESVTEDLAEDEMVIVKARLGRLDDIHSTHINQTITALRGLESVMRSVK